MRASKQGVGVRPQFVVVLACLVALGVTSQTAKADEFLIGQSGQVVKYTGDGSGDVNVQFGACSYNGVNTACTLSGTGYSLNITYAGHTDTTEFGPGSNGVFQLVSANWLTSTVTLGPDTYPLVYDDTNDGSKNPHFDGTYDSGGVFDYTLKNIQSPNSCTGISGPPSNCTLDNVADTSGATVSQEISSGEFDAPEPASALLMASLLGLAVILRRRITA